MKLLTTKQLSELSHKDQVRFALFCAYQVKNEWEKSLNCINAIKATELWLENKVTSSECHNAASTAFSNPNKNVYTAAYAAYAASADADADVAATYTGYVASTAAYARATQPTYPDNKIKIIQDQIDYYNELRYIDENFEKIVLEGL
jgi:hypothetical protein